jgi:hypothetical protein
MSDNTITQTLNQMKSSSSTFIISILILLVLAVTIYYAIYYRNLQKNECKNMTELYGDLNGKIISIRPHMPKFQYTFKDYYIKSAYNACSGGDYKNDYVDTCILTNILKQGIRGLDFEIFSVDDDMPAVATSVGDSYFIKETFNYIKFSDIMQIINNYAFAQSTAPNPVDPIILHLRFKSSNQNMYKNMAKILESYSNILLGKEYSYEYQGKNLGNVKLTELLGKVIIIVDKNNDSFMESQEFYEYVNMTSNSVFMRALNYYDIAYTPDMNELIEYNKLNMTIGMPDKGSNPANPSSVLMREMGCQMLGMRYQEIDINIEENDIFFDEGNSAFVLKPENLRYKPVEIELPAPQNPELSYASRTVQADFYKFDI